MTRGERFLITGIFYAFALAGVGLCLNYVQGDVSLFYGFVGVGCVLMALEILVNFTVTMVLDDREKRQ